MDGQRDRKTDSSIPQKYSFCEGIKPKILHYFKMIFRGENKNFFIGQGRFKIRLKILCILILIYPGGKMAPSPTEQPAEEKSYWGLPFSKVWIQIGQFRLKHVSVVITRNMRNVKIFNITITTAETMKCICLTLTLTPSQTSPGFYVSAVQVFWKYCGKRRNCKY